MNQKHKILFSLASSVSFWKLSSVREKVLFLISNIFKIYFYKEVCQSSHEPWSYFCHSRWWDRYAPLWPSALWRSACRNEHQSILETAATHALYHEKAWHERLKLTLPKYYSSQHKRLSRDTLQACLLPCQIKEVKRYQKGRRKPRGLETVTPGPEEKSRKSFSNIKSHQYRNHKYFTNISWGTDWYAILSAQYSSGMKLSPRSISSSMGTLLLTKEKILVSRPIFRNSKGCWYFRKGKAVPC